MGLASGNCFGLTYRQAFIYTDSFGVQEEETLPPPKKKKTGEDCFLGKGEYQFIGKIK